MFPGQYGIPRPFYFFLTPSYWCGTPVKKKSLIKGEDVPVKIVAYLTYSTIVCDEIVVCSYLRLPPSNGFIYPLLSPFLCFDIIADKIFDSTLSKEIK